MHSYLSLSFHLQIFCIVCSAGSARECVCVPLNANDIADRKSNERPKHNSHIMDFVRIGGARWHAIQIIHIWLWILFRAYIGRQHQNYSPHYYFASIYSACARYLSLSLSLARARLSIFCRSCFFFFISTICSVQNKPSTLWFRCCLSPSTEWKKNKKTKSLLNVSSVSMLHLIKLYVYICEEKIAFVLSLLMFNLILFRFILGRIVAIVGYSAFARGNVRQKQWK